VEERSATVLARRAGRPSPSKEAVADHVLAKQKNDGYQDDYEEELCNP